MAKLTDEGYKLKTQNEWFEEEKQRYLDIDPNWNLDPSTPDGMKLATDSEIWANLDEAGQRAYNSKDPNRATGNDLDVVCSITGTVRDDGTPSDVDINLTGTNGFIVPAGTLFESTENGSQWALDNDIPLSGVTSATATCIVNGSTQASIGVITKIVNPIAGLSTVTNPSVSTPGTDPETDSELRQKRKAAVSLPGQNQVDSTFAAISNLDDVRRVKIYENDDTSPTDPNGLPIHSTAIVVDGGDDQDIAEATYFKRNPGPIQHELSNPVSVSVTSPVTGNVKTIKFNRPDYVDITVVYNITNDGTLPPNIVQLIKDATIAYADGTLVEADCGFNQTGFDIGEDVQAGRLYTPANQVIGQYGDSYVTSVTVNGVASVAINFEELSRFTDPNIVVNIT